MDSSPDRFVQLGNGIRICYRTDGSPTGVPLILIAGLGQQLTAWPRELINAFVAQDYFVIRLDNRDAGRSTKVDLPPPSKARLFTGRPLRGAYTLADMAGDVLGLVDHLGLSSVHLVGQSMGGMIAQTAAAHAPDAVSTLVSIYSTTGNPRVGRTSALTKLLLARRPPRNPEEAVEAHLALTRHLAGKGFPIDETAERAYATTAWVRAGGPAPEAFVRQIQAIQASGDRTEEVSSITAPTLVINGDRDLIVHPSGGSATARAIPGARHVVVPGMGHHLAPTLIPRLVAHILSAHERASRQHLENPTQESA